MKFKVMTNFLLKQMYSDRRGNGQKPTRTKPSTQKFLWQNPRTKTFTKQLRKNLYKGLLSGCF